MKLIFSGDRFETEGCEYGERMIPKNAGFKWDDKEKVWYTYDGEVAVLLIEYADDQVWQLLDNALGLS